MGIVADEPDGARRPAGEYQQPFKAGRGLLPEERLTAMEGKDWEACMTFNRISWGYLDSAQAEPYSYNAHGILRMLHTVCESGGNLLLNIGPMPDGRVPKEAIEPLQTVGRWLQTYGDDAVYGRLTPCQVGRASGTGRFTQRGNKAYFWQFIRSDQLIFGGFETQLKSIRVLPSGTSLAFEQTERQIVVEPPRRSLQIRLPTSQSSSWSSKRCRFRRVAGLILNYILGRTSSREV